MPLLLILLFHFAFASSSDKCLEALKETGVTSFKNLSPFESFFERYPPSNYEFFKGFYIKNGQAIIDHCPVDVKKQFSEKIDLNLLSEIYKEMSKPCMKSSNFEECNKKNQDFKTALYNLGNGTSAANASTSATDKRHKEKHEDKTKFKFCCVDISGGRRCSSDENPPDECEGARFRYACDENCKPIDSGDIRANIFNNLYNPKCDPTKFKDCDVKLEEVKLRTPKGNR